MVLFVPKDIRLMVWDFVSKNNIGQRSKANGNKEQQYVGLLGEVMIAITSLPLLEVFLLEAVCMSTLPPAHPPY